MPSNLAPRLMIDVTNTIYEISQEAEPKRDNNGAQKIDRDLQLPMWSVVLYGRGRVAGKKWSAVFNVTVCANDRPTAEEGTLVVPVDLEAMPWANKRANGEIGSGIAFRATALEPVEVPERSLVGAAS